jgi:hypothetical protein
LKKTILCTVFLAILTSAGPTFADEAFLSASYGGTISESTSRLEIGERWTNFGGYSLVGVQFWAPEVVFGLNPFASFDYLWIKGTGTAEPKAGIIALGLGKTVPLGHASLSILAGVSQFRRSLKVWPGSDNSFEIESKEIGGVFGGFLRFDFFNKVDALMGYKLNICSDLNYSGTTAFDHEVTLTSSGIQHLLYVGIGVGIGM